MKKFWIDCLFATLFVFVCLYGLKQLTNLKILSAFDVIGQAVADMEVADITFSQLREDPPVDTNIVIVNIGNLSRGQVGLQINNMRLCGAKVIGLDAFYSCDFCDFEKDSVN